MEWGASHAVAILSGLLAAFWAAVGFVVRQRAAQRVPAGPAGAAESPALVTTLVREPSWWAGILATVGGYVFQVLALAHGSLLLVQPLLVSSLMFALPLNARVRRQRVSWAERGWAALLTAALAVLLGVVVLGEHVGVRRPGAIILVVAVWAMLAATVSLARSQAGEQPDPSVLQRYSSPDSDARLATTGSQLRS